MLCNSFQGLMCIVPVVECHRFWKAWPGTGNLTFCTGTASCTIKYVSDQNDGCELLWTAVN